jgi:hypothetical protein
MASVQNKAGFFGIRAGRVKRSCPPARFGRARRARGSLSAPRSTERARPAPGCEAVPRFSAARRKAEQLVVARQRGVNISELAHQLLVEKALHPVDQGRVERRTEVLMQLGADGSAAPAACNARRCRGETQSPLPRPGRQSSARSRVLPRPTHRCRPERRHMVLRIDVQTIIAIFELLGPEVDLDELIGKTGFEQGDMRGQRSGAGRIIQLHRGSPSLRTVA